MHDDVFLSILSQASNIMQKESFFKHARTSMCIDPSFTQSEDVPSTILSLHTQGKMHFKIGASSHTFHSCHWCWSKKCNWLFCLVCQSEWNFVPFFSLSNTILQQKWSLMFKFLTPFLKFGCSKLHHSCGRTSQNTIVVCESAVVCPTSDIQKWKGWFWDSLKAAGLVN